MSFSKGDRVRVQNYGSDRPGGPSWDGELGTVDQAGFQCDEYFVWLDNHAELLKGGIYATPADPAIFFLNELEHVTE